MRTKPSPFESLAISLFVLTGLLSIVRNKSYVLVAGVAFVLMVIGVFPQQQALAFLVGASVMALVQTSGRTGIWEGFEDGSGNKAVPAAAAEPTPAKESPAAAAAAAAATDEAEKAAAETFAVKSKPLLPDNRDRKEMLELGKPYKLPTESDDKGYHLDAGTTFLNAYKALKPDQIAAMTRDTQELLSTQKSLVGMLESFGPLMKDMNKITGFLNAK